ncbi:hypothetical protein HK101_001613 [Irineochytrium annulatum]|nr:hypothetical protein HK101_001613 [Irineochytrium annulatum]
MDQRASKVPRTSVFGNRSMDSVPKQRYPGQHAGEMADLFIEPRAPPLLDASRCKSDRSRLDTPQPLTPSAFETPKAKLVKPLASAFASEGLKSKNSRPRSLSAQPTPDTPLKRIPLSASSCVKSNANIDDLTALTKLPVFGLTKSTTVNPRQEQKQLPFQLPPTPTRPLAVGGFPLNLQLGGPLGVQLGSTQPAQPAAFMVPQSPAPMLSVPPMTSKCSLIQRRADEKPDRLSAAEVTADVVAEPASAAELTVTNSASGACIPMDCDDEPRTPITTGPPPETFKTRLYGDSRYMTPYPRFLTSDQFPRLCGGAGGPSDPPPQMFSRELQTGLTCPDYFESNFKPVSKLGRGSFADAFKVQNKADLKLYAVKKSRIPFSGSMDREDKLEEIEIMWLVRDGPQIVKIMNAWEQNGLVYLQMELCERGNLCNYLEENCRASPIDEFRIWQTLCEVTMALDHIHALDVMHLDIKPGNIFITASGSLKVGDFGLATRCPVAIGFEREGDRTYIAPEILESKYGKACDIFSLGLIILEMAANIVLPENGPHWHKLRDHNFSECSFAACTPPLIDIMKHLLNPEPTKRPLAKQILEHPYVKTLIGSGGEAEFKVF